ncbi:MULTISPECIES: hypothetical protein [Pseudomonas]|uniref:Uncharacterized protein n=1 Tax=Pseudomonas folii TaxID=2762593 RepID=A0ABR7AVH6_9PSED|nr:MULTISPECIES: hypothetical protein [Pseudomonas]MBC3948928.1 hypothetical protein [Pseudomonas folii]
MTTISTQSPVNNDLTLLQGVTKKADTEATQGEPNAAESAAAPVGVKVSLSAAGLNKAKAKNDNSDITESGLPGSVQQTLIRIRELKQQIAEKMAELQAAMANKSMSPEARQAKVAGLQTALASLNSGLMAASAALDKASKNGTMDATQAKQAAVLAMKSQ